MSRQAREERIRAAMRERRPADVQVDHYPPGQAPDTFAPGDFSLHRATTTHGRTGATTALGKLIQAGERSRFGDCDFARWTHSALIVSETGDICEAIESGVARDNIEKYRGTDYIVVHVTASEIQRGLACAFAETRVGDRYGVLNFVGLAIQAMFGWNVSLHMDGQFICSGLVSRATEKYIVGYPRSPESMMPGDLAYFWDANSGEPLPPLGLFGRFLNLLVTVGDLISGNRGDPAPDPGHPPSPPAPAPAEAGPPSPEVAGEPTGVGPEVAGEPTRAGPEDAGEPASAPVLTPSRAPRS